MRKDPNAGWINDIQFWPDDDVFEISFNDWSVTFKVAIEFLDKDPDEFWSDFELKNEEIKQNRAKREERRRELSQMDIIKEWEKLNF